MRKTEIQAPAKINLFLEVLPQKTDNNLHPIETIIEKVTLFDLISLIVTPGRMEIACNLPELARTSNLAWKAAQLLKERYRIREGVHIQIKKKIPLAAGLGGGSSDAAAVLLGLNKLWKIEEEPKNLTKIAFRLGSDVPAFLAPGRCLVSGCGEKVRPLSSKPELNYLLVLTGIRVKTKEAYRWIDNLTYQPYSSKIMVAGLKKGGTRTIGERLFNRFQEVLRKRERKIKIWEERLKGTFSYSLMTGSGGAFFVLLDRRPDTDREFEYQKGKLVPVRTFRRQHGDY